MAELDCPKILVLTLLISGKQTVTRSSLDDTETNEFVNEERGEGRRVGITIIIKWGESDREAVYVESPQIKIKGLINSREHPKTKPMDGSVSGHATKATKRQHMSTLNSPDQDKPLKGKENTYTHIYLLVVSALASTHICMHWQVHATYLSYLICIVAFYFHLHLLYIKQKKGKRKKKREKEQEQDMI